LRAATRIFGADDAVDEAEGELQPARIFQQPGQALGTGVDGCSHGRIQPAEHLLLDGFEAREIARAVIRHVTEDKPTRAAPGIEPAAPSHQPTSHRWLFHQQMPSFS